MSGCTLNGGQAPVLPCGAPGALPAIDLVLAQIWATQSVVTGGQLPAGPGVAADLRTGSQLSADPSAQFVGGVDGSGTTLHRAPPAGRGAARGGPMPGALTASPLRLGAGAASLGIRAPLVVPEGRVWADMQSAVVLGVGALGAGGFGGSFFVPPFVPRGLPVT